MSRGTQGRQNLIRGKVKSSELIQGKKRGEETSNGKRKKEIGQGLSKVEYKTAVYQLWTNKGDSSLTRKGEGTDWEKINRRKVKREADHPL